MSKVTTIIIALLVFSSPLASCASATMFLYSGEMELVTVSGSGCSEKYQPGSRIPLDLTLEQGGPSNGKQIDGYIQGQNIQIGHFTGNDLTRLQVVYPDEPNPEKGHSLALATTSEGIIKGELREKPQEDSTNCYFEKAILNLERKATDSKAKIVLDRQSEMYSAEANYISGQSLLKADKPEDAIRDLTKSLNIRNILNPNNPDRAFPAVSIAVAHIMAGREPKALAVIRDLLMDNSRNEEEKITQRMTVSIALCNNIQYFESDAGQKASTQLIDIVAREFGRLDGMSVPIAACYYEMGKERKGQDDPDLAIDYFQKSLNLNPDNPDSITGLVLSLVDKEKPAEARKYLNSHSQIYIRMAGRETYEALLSYLISLEARQEENNGKLPHSEELFREALKSKPGVFPLIINLTRVLGREGKFAEARKLLVDGRKNCPGEACRQEFADEIARQVLIERMVKRLEATDGMH